MLLLLLATLLLLLFRATRREGRTAAPQGEATARRQQHLGAMMRFRGPFYLVFRFLKHVFFLVCAFTVRMT
jgi:hypothetical protein